jgi:hypothetical protein
MVQVKEGLFVANDAFLVVFVPFVYVLYYLFLDFGGFDVFGHWADDLSREGVTFMA